MGEASKLDVPQGLGATGVLIVGVVLFAPLFWLSRLDYLLFHSILELVVVLVAFGVFVIAWNTRHMVSSSYLLVLGVPQVFVGAVLLLHVLAYKGMGVFLGHGHSAGLATQLWIVARLLAASAFLVSGVSLRRPVRLVTVFTAFGVVTVASLASIFGFDTFPAMYVDGVGLTPLKVAAEYVIMAIAAAGLWLLWRSRDRFEPRVARLLGGSIVAMIAAELSFTLYVDVYGFLNFLGHYFALASLMMMYLAVIETALVRPYSLLFYELKQLQESEHEIADILQTAIMRAPERVDSVEIGHAYVSATGGARVGGDFFDLFAPAPGFVAFVVGDVCGKGIHAAASTTMVRTTLRSFAYDDPDPVPVLRRSNASLVREFTSDKFATVIYGVLESATGRLRLASAGHPDPVLCWEEGATYVDLPRNPPLSITPDQEFGAAEVQLQDGGTLILFTDGLTDAGWRSGSFGTERVVLHAGANFASSPLDIAQSLMSEVESHAGGTLSDDVAIVVLRYSAPAQESYSA